MRESSSPAPWAAVQQLPGLCKSLAAPPPGLLYSSAWCVQEFGSPTPPTLQARWEGLLSCSPAPSHTTSQVGGAAVLQPRPLPQCKPGGRGFCLAATPPPTVQARWEGLLSCSPAPSLTVSQVGGAAVLQPHPLPHCKPGGRGCCLGEYMWNPLPSDVCEIHEAGFRIHRGGVHPAPCTPPPPPQKKKNYVQHTCIYGLKHRNVGKL